MTDVRGIEGASFEGTGYSYTLSLIQGKHKMPILYCLCASTRCVATWGR